MNAKKFLQVMNWIKTHKIDILENLIKEFDTKNKSYKIKNMSFHGNVGEFTFQYKETISNKKTKTTQQSRIHDILCEKSNRKIKITLNDHEIEILKRMTVANFKEQICKILQE